MTELLMVEDVTSQVPPGLDPKTDLYDGETMADTERVAFRKPTLTLDGFHRAS